MTRLSGLSILLLISVLVVGCGRPPAKPQAREIAQTTQVPADHLRWMLGVWSTDPIDDAVTTERWRANDDGALVGRSETRRGDEITHEEDMRIEERAGTFVFIASPASQATAEFIGSSTCTTHEPEDDECPRSCEAVFENPNHDFPKQITYRRCLQRDRLVATISGDDDQRRATWTYRLAREPGRSR